MQGIVAGGVAVVTGASSGLGRRFAHILADEGAAVALLARRTDRLQAEADAINARGGKAIALSLDVSDAHAIGPVLDQAQGALGPISIMINNAGVGGEGRSLDITPEDFDAAFAVNVRGLFFGAREAARRMIDNGRAQAGEARIINIASIASQKVLPGLTTYCGTKAAAAHMTKGMALEWARYGIAVNAICPGYIETEINAEWFASEAGKKQINGLPRRRLGQESDLDAALLMLAGPGARGMTGSLITVDDGQSL